MGFEVFWGLGFLLFWFFVVSREIFKQFISLSSTVDVQVINFAYTLVSTHSSYFSEMSVSC